MKDNDIWMKKIKSNRTLQKEMLKYNSKQWEMYYLYAVSAMLLFIGFIFTMIDMKVLGYIMMIITIVSNILIVFFRNKVTYVNVCKVKYITTVYDWFEISILEEIGEKHTDIFEYKKFDNFGYKKINGFEGIVFEKVSKNPSKLTGQELDEFYKRLKAGDEDARKVSDVVLSNTNIFKDDKAIAIKTISGYVFVVKYDERLEV